MTAEELKEQINTLKSQLDSLLEELARLEPDKNFKKEINNDGGKVGLRIVPDTSWLIAVIDGQDPHHIAASSSLGALQPYQPYFYVPVVVFMETMSRLIRVNKMSVKKCHEKILKLLVKEIHAKHEVTFTLENILKKYKTFSRVKKIKSLTPVDFYIIAEGIGLGARILTCDLKMYHATIKYYKNIYYLSDKAKNKQSDLSRLIQDIQRK